jgi:hypothetical protein
MTTNRARAYARVIALTDEMGAADALLFTVDVASDREAVELIRRLDATMDRLVDAGRLTETTADEIVEAVERCGPQTEPLQLPAAAV